MHGKSTLDRNTWIQEYGKNLTKFNKKHAVKVGLDKSLEKYWDQL